MGYNTTDINANLTVEQKFAKIMLHMRILRPFYSAIYEVIEKKPSNSVETVGVGTNDMVYNYEFIDKTYFDELVFVMLHEVAHLALQHVARRENRNPQLWNVACDLYVNQVLAEEFGIQPGTSKMVNGINITMLSNCLYCSSIDVDNDFTESIYEELEKQAKKNGFMQAYNQGDTDKSASGSGYSFTYTGSKKEDSGPYSQNSANRTFKAVIQPGKQMDLVDSGDEQSLKQQKADKLVSDAMVKVEMSSQACGDGSSGLLAHVKKMMKSQLDWRKLLRKYLISATTTDSSFSRPDKRMYYQKSIYPGQVSDEVNSIKGVKVCIDTSGSISDDDIAYFCGQVYELTKQFKINAELIYWDTSIQSTGEFEGYKEFSRVDIYGRGGTDPSVVFNYFDSKKCKIKPVVTLMFTDAFFSTDRITPKQRKKYKDTIWIMTRNHDKEFKPPFGKKAIAKFS